MNKRSTRRRFLETTGGVAAAVTMAGCSGADEGTEQETETDTETSGASTDEETEQPSMDGGTLNLLTGSMDTLDPIATGLNNALKVIDKMFDGLVYRPNGGPEVESLLATDYEISNGGKTYTFTLKEGATHHDGSEVTAQDFVYAWERLGASESSYWGHYLMDYINVERETRTEDGAERYDPGTMATEAIDDYTFEVTLNEPYHATLSVITSSWFAAVPEGLVDDIEGYDGQMSQSEFGKGPIGAGPFEFEDWQGDTEASVSRFEDYHRGAASIEGIHFSVMEDSNAIFNHAMNKNLDIMPRGGIPTSQYDPGKVQVESTDDQGRSTGTYGPVRNDEELQYLAYPSLGTSLIGFNMLNVPKAARQATAYAINHQQLSERIYKARTNSAYHMTPPGAFPGGPTEYDEHAKDYPYGYNESRMGEAVRVMEEAGYGENNKVEFTMTITDETTDQDLAGLIRDRLASAYIQLNIETAPFATMIERRGEGKLDSFLTGWTMGYPDPQQILQLLNPANTNMENSFSVIETNWVEDAKGTSAVGQAREAWKTITENPRDTESHRQARNEAFVQMEEANWEDVSFITYGHNKTERFMYDWVDAAKIGPVSSFQKHVDTQIDTDQQP